MKPITKKAPAKSPDARLSSWDQLCLQVLVWTYALAGPEGQRRVPERVLVSMPYLRADGLTVSAGLQPTTVHAVLSVLHRQGLVARLDGFVAITPRGRQQVRPL